MNCSVGLVAPVGVMCENWIGECIANIEDTPAARSNISSKLIMQAACDTPIARVSACVIKDFYFLFSHTSTFQLLDKPWS